MFVTTFGSGLADLDMRHPRDIQKKSRLCPDASGRKATNVPWGSDGQHKQTKPETHRRDPR